MHKAKDFNKLRNSQILEKRRIVPWQLNPDYLSEGFTASAMKAKGFASKSKSWDKKEIHSPRRTRWIWILSLCSYITSLGWEPRLKVRCKTKRTLTTRLSWAESFWTFMSDACWGCLWQLKAPPCKSSLPSGGKRTDVIWSGRRCTPAVSHGLQELKTVNLPLPLHCCWGVRSSPFLRHTANTVGVHSPQGSIKDSSWSLYWVQDTNTPLMMLTLFACQDGWASALCCNGWGCSELSAASDPCCLPSWSLGFWPQEDTNKLLFYILYREYLLVY